jgi:hypothetical protein
MARRKRKNSKPIGKVRRILAVLILIALLWPLYILGGRALCHIALAQIGGLTNTRIRTESVSFRAGGSVLIKKLVVSSSQEQDDDGAILKAGEVYARFSLGSLLLFRPNLKVIEVNDFVLNAQYDLDTDRWNLSGLKIKPPKDRPGKMPRVRLNSGILQYTKASEGKSAVAVSLPLGAEFGADEKAPEGYAFEIITANQASGFAPSRLTGLWKPGSVTIAGGISSVDIPQFEMAWIIDVMAGALTYDKDGTFSLKLNVTDLRSVRNPAPERLVLVEPSSAKSSPFAALQRFFDRYQPSGVLDVELDASGSLDRLSESTLTGTVRCKDISACYYKFKYAIEGLAGQIDFTNSSVKLNNLAGRHGDVRLFFNGWASGFGADLRYLVQIKSDNMPLDNDLYDALNPRQQEFWAAFSPAGSAAIDYQFGRESPTDKWKKLVVEPRGAEAVYCSFPYPLRDLTGKLVFERDRVVFLDLVSQADDSRITLNGEVVISGPNEPTYDISARIENIALDSTLEAALPAKQRDLFGRFAPCGLASGWVSISAQAEGPPSFTADLSFKEASMEFDELPLPVTNISARAVFSPASVVVKEFSGRYRDGSISMTGDIRPNDEVGRPLYDLSVRLEGAELNDDLFDLVGESTKKILAEWKPAGRVNLVADLDKERPSDDVNFTVALECLGNTVSFGKFPHPMKDLTGTIVFDGNVIELKDLSATLDYGDSEIQDEATVSVNGQVRLVDSAFDSALLRVLAKDILFDKQLSRTLPGRASSLYDGLAAPGRFDLDFEDVRIRRTDAGQKSIDFMGDVTLKSCGFRASGSRIELDSVLKTRGQYITANGFSDCRATLVDGTLRVWGKALSGLNADIFYDPNRARWSTKDLVADFYGGKLRGEFVFDHSAEGAGGYVLQTGFDNVDLKRFLADTKLEQAPENDYTTGQMDGSLSINAQLGDISSRIGACKLAISDMQVGKLSPLAKLLNVLQLNRPRDFAFDRMLVDSYIRGNNLSVRTLDLAGRAHAFSGSGQLGLDSLNVDLKLTARGRRPATDNPSILQSLTEGLGQAVVRIDVAGDLHEPQITTETLPVIRETLQVLGTRPASSN